MPIQYGRNPKSYPPNDNYRREWERIFGKKTLKAEKEGSGANVIDHLTRATRERYGDKQDGNR